MPGAPAFNEQMFEPGRENGGSEQATFSDPFIRTKIVIYKMSHTGQITAKKQQNQLFVDYNKPEATCPLGVCSDG